MIFIKEIILSIKQMSRMVTVSQIHYINFLMQVQPQSNTVIRQQELQQQNNQQTQFTIVQFDGNSYRVSAEQYTFATISVHLFWALWSSICLIHISLIIQNFVQTNAIVAMSAGVGAALIITGVVIKFRKNLPLFVLFSFVNLDAYLIVCLILVILEIKSMLYPTIPFSIIELLILGIILEKKVKVLIYLPLIAQVYLIILQIDGYIEIQMATVFFIVTILVSCSLSVSIVGFLYLFIKIMIQERTSKIKKYGLIIVFLGFTSIGVSLGVLPQYFMFDLEVWIGSIVALACILLTIVFLVWNIQKAKLFLCDLEIVKGNSLTVKKRQMPKIQYSFYRFMKVSDNWYKKITQDQLNEVSTNRQVKESQSVVECLICLENMPSAIWMPCGHLTACEICCEHMIKKNNISCILCKKVPKQIYIIEREEKIGNLTQNKKQQGTIEQMILNKRHEKNLEEREEVIEEIDRVIRQKQIFQIKMAYKINIL